MPVAARAGAKRMFLPKNNTPFLTVAKDLIGDLELNSENQGFR